MRLFCIVTINIQYPSKKHIYFKVDVEEPEINPIRAPIGLSYPSLRLYKRANSTFVSCAWMDTDCGIKKE